MARFFVAGALVRATRGLVPGAACCFVSSTIIVTLLPTDNYTFAAVIIFLFNLKIFQVYKR